MDISSFEEAVDHAANQMRRIHRDSAYTPEERAFDHACSYPSSDPLFKFWVAVGDRIAALNESGEKIQ